MNSSKRESEPDLLGKRLKRLREDRRESLAEVSGAVEIDTEHLERIENGAELPSEDILTLLINHFSLQEHEAVQLWDWAGFEHPNDQHDAISGLASKAAIVLVAIDARVLYSDEASILAGKNGIIMNFAQNGTLPNQAPIARIGMSYEQAEQIMRELQRVLLRKQYLPEHPQLPPGENPPKE